MKRRWLAAAQLGLAMWLFAPSLLSAQQPMAATTAESTRAPDDLQMSPEELAALGLGSQAPAVDLDLKLSGFADVGFGTIFAADDSYWRASGAVPTEPSFYVGNLNLYAAKNLTDTLRSMIEVRLSFLPNGSSTFGQSAPVSTVTSDYTDFGRSTRWGSIILQRAYVEWEAHALCTIRGGMFLSPYGVWNVDHGSPVVIPVRRPWSIGVGWIPERQTGVEIYGRHEISATSAIGYHLTLSNGNGPISEYADLDSNKALGWRAFYQLRALGLLRIGASGYYGRSTDAVNLFALSNGMVGSNRQIKEQYDALTWAFDLTWDLENLHVQTEWLTNQRAYTKRGRVATTSVSGTQVPSDTISWGGYVMVGYRLPWLGIMPFIQGERVSGDLNTSKVSFYAFQFGLNIRPVDMLVLKATWEHVEFQQELAIDPLNVLMTQVAWAF